MNKYAGTKTEKNLETAFSGESQDAARIRRRILRSLPEAERKSAQDRNCVWRTDRQKNSNGNT